MRVSPQVNARSKPVANGESKSANGYSKQSDYYINGNGLSRPDLVHRATAGAHWPPPTTTCHGSSSSRRRRRRWTVASASANDIAQHAQNIF